MKELLIKTNTTDFTNGDRVRKVIKCENRGTSEITGFGIWEITHSEGVIASFSAENFYGLKPGTLISCGSDDGEVLYLNLMEPEGVISGLATPSETPSDDEDLTVAVNLNYIRKLEARIAALESQLANNI